MNASELRIGNFVELTCEGHEDEPDLVIWGIEDYEYYDYRMNDINPIPITEEWLVKCGFVKDSKIEYLMGHINNTYTKSYLIIGTYDNVFSPCVRMYDRDDWAYYEEIGENIKYLHQLQNLYFALTGEELTINL